MAGTGSSRDISPKASLASLRELHGTEHRLALEAIRRGLTPSATQEEKNIALLLACTHGQILDAKLLIKVDADLSLDLASSSGPTNKYSEQLTSLFNKTIDPEGAAPFILDCVTSDFATFSQATTGVILRMDKDYLKETLLGKASGLERTATICWDMEKASGLASATSSDRSCSPPRAPII